MAQSFKFITLVAIALPSILVSAKEFIVGDQYGWTLNFDYQAWAQGKDFRVGDTLVFKYSPAHNVFKVNQTLFQTCKGPFVGEGLNSGHDIIKLETPGKKWYACGIYGHCARGVKLAITVQPLAPEPALAPALAPTAGGRFAFKGRVNSWFLGWF